MEANQGEPVQEPTPRKGGRKPSARWLTLEEVMERYGNMGIATLNRWIRREVFPQGVTFGGRLRMWDERELDAFDDRARAARDAVREVKREKQRASEEKIKTKKARGTR